MTECLEINTQERFCYKTDGYYYDIYRQSKPVYYITKPEFEKRFQTIER